MSDKFVDDDVRPHVDTWVCGKCRKQIGEGHRIHMVQIAKGKGVNPANLHQTGLLMYDEWEYMHADCRDPFLKKGLQ